MMPRRRKSRKRRRNTESSVPRNNYPTTTPQPVLVEATHKTLSSDEDDLTDYDLLVGSLRVLKKPHLGDWGSGKSEEESGDERDMSGDERDGSGLVTPGSGDERDGSGLVTPGSGDEGDGSGLVTQESDSEPEDRSGVAVHSEDPFCRHFEQDLTEDEVRGLEKILSEPLHYEQSTDPVLGAVSQASCLRSREPAISYQSRLLTELYVKQKLAHLWCNLQAKDSTASGHFSPLQQYLFPIMNSYKDLVFTRRTFENGEEIRRTYLLHALNHVMKTRSRVLKNNAKLLRASKEGRKIEEELRDQGLTRPKVLIVLPFREAALRTVNTIISLVVPQDEGQVSYRKRFQEEYGEAEYSPSKLLKPASFEAMFAGNIDDCFKLGVAIKNNTVRLYTEFYNCDIIITSSLGLRMVIGAEGEKDRDHDFLSSLEVIIVDQADVFLMQNWDHMLHLFSHLHLQPRDSHGVDFSRVRNWAINGWSKFYRQTLLFSSFPTAEINALFNKHCHNYAGKVKVSAVGHNGSISQVVSQVPQAFHRIPCHAHTELPEARFTYFTEEVLPEYRGELMKHTAVFVPSYFDFVRLRNFMRKEEINFAQICEYSTTSDISRARTKFFHGKRHFLLYTERVHFFKRFRLRGIRHIIFYCLPLYCEFYPELVNFLEAGQMGGVSCTVLYSRYDTLSLCRIVGSDRAKRMLAAQDSVHMLVTGAH